MILSGWAITNEVKVGNISIRPFKDSSVNPNSYNYSLGNELVAFETGEITLDSPGYNRLTIPETGYVLQPGRLYLGVTQEIIGSRKYATSLIGRSSIGRLGLWLQATADLGHVGNKHNWTLELKVVQPLRIFPGMKVGQVTFWHCVGKTSSSYQDKYANDYNPTLSRLKINDDFNRARN